MTLPKKGLRKITVNGSRYGWKVTGNDGWIDLYIESQEAKNGQLLNAKFNYHHEPKATIGSNNPTFKISSGITKQVIKLGLESGWKPREQKPVFSLGHVDRKVDLFSQ